MRSVNGGISIEVASSTTVGRRIHMIGCIRPFALAVMLGAATFSQTVSACLNTHEDRKDARSSIASRLFSGEPWSSDPSGGWEKKASDLAADSSFATDPKKRNDYAVALIHLNRIPEAIPILEEIEAKSPGDYLTAVNLGTAYERSGRNELALKWITEGIKRNPASHEGTEWLHARIIEAKLAIQKDPTWLEKRSIFDGGAALTGDDAKPAPPRPFLDGQGKPRDAKDIIKAIDYQLGERTRFVKPPEPIVAELLIEYASLIAQESGEGRWYRAELPVKAMDMAGEYKPVRAALYAARKSHFEEVQRLLYRLPTHEARDELIQTTFPVILLGLGIFLFYLIRWILRRRKATAEPS